jgi:N-acyl-D-amino-acid deacylase
MRMRERAALPPQRRERMLPFADPETPILPKPMKRTLPLLLVVLHACAPAAPPALAPDAAPYDVVITGGRIVDGTGNAWYHGDVAVRGDRIARIVPPGALAGAQARERVNAAGRVVAPGFIDIQSHSRGAFLGGDGRVVSKITQGVTTEIMGEGTTNAPANQNTLGELDPEESERAAEILARFGGPRGFDAWLRAMEEHGASPNIGSFLGGGTLRRYVKGLSPSEMTQEETDTMRAVVRRAMEDGAFGIATALIYAPGSFSTTEELIEASRAMAPYGGVYITHLRSEGDQLLEALDEAIRIGEEAGVPVEIYHLKAAGQRNWELGPRSIAMIDSARALGQDVQANVYPYPAAGTGLTSCLPAWAAADGRLFDNLRDPDMRARIRAEMVRERSDWENFCVLAGPEGVMVLGLQRPEHAGWVGWRLSQIAEAQGRHWADTAIDLIVAEGQRISTMYFLMSEENVALNLQQPWIKVGTDAGGADPERARGLAHPRAYGTFTRVLGRYVRDEGVLSLEEAVRRMSSATATRLGIRDRGLLAEGMFADIVVFDPETVGDRATYEAPHQLSVGVEQVWVNGQRVLRDGVHTGAKPGRIVRGPGWRAP